MEQQTQEIDHSIRSTLVGASISAVAAFLGGLIGGTVGMASAGAAAALIVAKYIKPFRSLLSVIDLKWIMAQLKNLKFLESQLNSIIKEVLLLISDILDCKTIEDRKALLKQHVVIPGLSYVISRAIPFILRELMNCVKYFV